MDESAALSGRRVKALDMPIAGRGRPVEKPILGDRRLHGFCHQRDGPGVGADHRTQGPLGPDVNWREDQSRVRRGAAPRILASLEVGPKVQVKLDPRF